MVKSFVGERGEEFKSTTSMLVCENCPLGIFPWDFRKLFSAAIATSIYGTVIKPEPQLLLGFQIDLPKVNLKAK